MIIETKEYKLYYCTTCKKFQLQLEEHLAYNTKCNNKKCNSCYALLQISLDSIDIDNKLYLAKSENRTYSKEIVILRRKIPVNSQMYIKIYIIA